MPKSLSHVVVLYVLGSPDLGLLFSTYFGYAVVGSALFLTGQLLTGELPRAFSPVTGLSWQVNIMPYIELGNLYNNFDTTTDNPSRARKSAVERPATPAPMTQTSARRSSASGGNRGTTAVSGGLARARQRT